MSFENCPDCDYTGDGKCSRCHGSGLEANVFDAMSDALVGDEQTCKVCNGDGKCQTCNGKGYLEQDD